MVHLIGMLPIRKIAPAKVALSTNYGKLFVSRTERKSFDEFSYIVNYIKDSYLNDQGIITKIKPGNSYSNLAKLPNTYTSLSKHFNTIETNTHTLIFDHKSSGKYVDEKVLADITSKKLVFIGYNSKKEILVTDYNDDIFNYSVNMEPLGDIIDLLQIDRTKVPSSFSVINILGDHIPLGVALAYYLNLSDLLSITGATHQLIESNKQYKPTKNQIVLKFLDYKLIIDTKKKEHQLLFNGFLYFRDILKTHNLKEFDYDSVYLTMFEHRNLSLVHIKELDMLKDLFIDPITASVLAGMNEPTDYLKLLLRANELLDNFYHPDVNDPSYSRIRGYDRVPGLMYKALAESVRASKFKGTSKSKIELDPYKVWNYVTQDNTVKITEDNNPITDAKETESVTLSGLDGFNKDATPVLMRKFHKNDIGFMSEATVDSSDVALNTYLTPYARLDGVRGLLDKDSTEHIENKAKFFSTSALLVPGVEHDDPKRINFINIQNGHTIASVGYTQPLLRTGYEYLMPYKVGKLYCSIAKDDGVVTAKTNKLLTVKYKDGSTEGIQIGSRYGRMEGSVYPHEIVTELQVNSKFKKNQYLAYNTGFFEKDWLDPSKLIMKFGKSVSVAMSIVDEVFEDSSAISEELSKEMTTTVLKEKTFVIEFDKNIINLVEQGSTVKPNDILFTVLDENTNYTNLSESAIDMLQSLAALAPKAKVSGVIDRLEVRYNGELSDMSPSLRKLVTKLDKDLYEETKGTENEAMTNRVDSEYRVSGKNLNIDTLALTIFIRVSVSQAVGDKGVFGAQMKSVISDVYTNKITTESGVKVDALFSYTSILNRIVNSPILTGTTNRILKHVSKQVADLYFS